MYQWLSYYKWRGQSLIFLGQDGLGCRFGGCCDGKTAHKQGIFQVYSLRKTYYSKVYCKASSAAFVLVLFVWLFLVFVFSSAIVLLPLRCVYFRFPVRLALLSAFSLGPGHIFRCFCLTENERFLECYTTQLNLSLTALIWFIRLKLNYVFNCWNLQTL